MKFMVLVKANAQSEAGVLPTDEQFAEMGAFNEEMVKAGVMLDGEGLHASSRGARIAYDGDKRAVTGGPFPETKQLVAGFWLIQAPSMDEAVAWMSRAPFREGEVEIRQVMEAEDFGNALTAELREDEQRLRARTSTQR